MNSLRAFYPLISTLARDGALVVETSPLPDGAARLDALAARTTVQFDGDVVSIFDRRFGFPAREAHFAAVNKTLADLEVELRRASRWVRGVALTILAGRRIWQAGALAAAIAGGASAVSMDLPVPSFVLEAAWTTLPLAVAGCAFGAVLECAGRLLKAAIRKRLSL